VRLKLEAVLHADHGRSFEDGMGYRILRGANETPGDFSRFVREVLDSSGDEFVALPVSDGRLGYDEVFVIPLDPGA
jgi:hypothetical protein